MPQFTPFTAAMIAEGEFTLAGMPASEETYIEAYQYLIDTGLAWTLQGSIGRQAAALIEAGHCTTE